MRSQQPAGDGPSQAPIEQHAACTVTADLTSSAHTTNARKSTSPTTAQSDQARLDHPQQHSRSQQRDCRRSSSRPGALRPTPQCRRIRTLSNRRGRSMITGSLHALAPLAIRHSCGQSSQGGSLRFLDGGGHGCSVRVRSISMSNRSTRWCWSRSAAWSRWASRTGTNERLTRVIPAATHQRHGTILRVGRQLRSVTSVLRREPLLLPGRALLRERRCEAWASQQPERSRASRLPDAARVLGFMGGPTCPTLPTWAGWSATPGIASRKPRTPPSTHNAGPGRSTPSQEALAHMRGEFTDVMTSCSRPGQSSGS